MNAFWLKRHKEITTNLQQDLDENYSKITSIIEKLTQKGMSFDYIRVFRDNDAILAMERICACIRKKYKIIFEDYGIFLSKNDLNMLVLYIEQVNQLARETFDVKNIDLSPRGVWQDEMGVFHNDTEEDRETQYRLQFNLFIHNLQLQKIRTLNAFYRYHRERINRGLEVWVPIIISIFALIVSVVSLFTKKESM